MKQEITAVLMAGAVFAAVVSRICAQTSADVRQAFVDIRNDNIAKNCCHAIAWLEDHRRALRDQMLEELYRTDDAQARDALLIVLFQTENLDRMNASPDSLCNG